MTDMAWIIRIAHKLACAFFLSKGINTMLSVLFTTESFCSIKEINNEEKSFW